MAINKTKTLNSKLQEQTMKERNLETDFNTVT